MKKTTPPEYSGAPIGWLGNYEMMANYAGVSRRWGYAKILAYILSRYCSESSVMNRTCWLQRIKIF